MARESDPWKRMREAEREAEHLKAKQKKTLGRGLDTPDDNINTLMDQAGPLIDQVNAAYRQYVNGVESLPPLQRRRRLDELINKIQNLPKPSSSVRFKVGTLVQNYLTHRDRWDRTMRQIESGQIKRKKLGAGG